MAIDEDAVEQAIEEAFDFQSAERGTSGKKKTNWNPNELLKAQKEVNRQRSGKRAKTMRAKLL